MESYFVKPASGTAKRSGRKWGVWVISASLVLFLGYCSWIACGPDQTVVFTREALIHADPSDVARKLDTVSEWKKWFYVMDDVQIVDTQDRPLPDKQQIARVGAVLKFLVDPKKGQRRKFEIVGKISRFEPGKLVEIELLDDSAGKIFRLFDRLSWKIEVDQNRILATEVGHTSHWRSRVFSRIAKRILMSQLFYPNVMILADPGSAPHSEP